MALDYITPLGEETGQRMLSALQGIAAEQAKLVLLKEQELNSTLTTIADWNEVATLIGEGIVHDVFPVGSVVSTAWADPRSAVDTNWSYGMRMAGLETINTRGHTGVPCMTLHSKLALPFATAFDDYEGFYAVPAAGLAAGTYSVAFGNTSAWGQVPANAVVSFTLEQAYTEGALLRFSGSVYSTAPASLNVCAFADLAAIKSRTATETAACSSGAAEGATSLGTIPATVADYSASGQLNHLHRVGLGSNRWATSALRQYLNSSAAAGAWWEPQSKWDYPPAYLATTAGHLSGFSADFVEHLAQREVKTALPYCDGGTSGGTECDTTYDRVWLPSAEQLCWNPTWLGVPLGLEGAALPYWREVWGSDAPATMGQVHTEFCMAGMGAETTMRGVFERSAYRSYGGNVACCYAGGTLYGNYASYGGCCAPAYSII